MNTLNPLTYPHGGNPTPLSGPAFMEEIEARPVAVGLDTVAGPFLHAEMSPSSMPVFPELFREREDDIGPATPVSALVGQVARSPWLSAHLATRPSPEAAAAPAAPESAAVRQELAALQEVLFDVALAVTKRNTELAGLEERLAAAHAATEDISRLKAQVAGHQEELERAVEHHTGLLTEIAGVKEELAGLSLREQALVETIAGLEHGVGRLETAKGALEDQIETRTAELEAMEASQSRQTHAQTELTRQIEALQATLVTLTEDKELAMAAVHRVRNSLCDAQLEFESLMRGTKVEQAAFEELSTRRATLEAQQGEIEAAVDQKSRLLATLGENAAELSSQLAREEAASLAKQEAAHQRYLEMEQSAAAATTRLEDAWRDLTLAEARQEELARENTEVSAALQNLRQQHDPLQTEFKELKAACETKSAELSRLDREVLQTRQEIHGLKRKAEESEEELAARRLTLEAGLETIEAAHLKAQQAMVGTQTRYEALLVKQDEALQQLDALESRRRAIPAEARPDQSHVPALATALVPVVLPVSAVSNAAHQDAEARLAALDRESAALEDSIAAKISRNQAIEVELRRAAEHLAGLNSHAAAEQQRFNERHHQMEEEIAAATRTLQQAKDSLLHNPWQQELSNRHSAALNELDATSSQVADLKAEAAALQEVVLQRQAQKDALLDEILKAPKPPAPPSYQNSGTKPPEDRKQSDNAWEQIVPDLMRLVDATDTAHSFIVKMLTPEAVHGQFTLLREAITSSLDHLGVTEFVLPQGLLVDSTLRRQIQVVKHLTGDSKPWIHAMLSPGFLLQGADGQKTLLRKPEVILSSEPQLA